MGRRILLVDRHVFLQDLCGFRILPIFLVDLCEAGIEFLGEFLLAQSLLPDLRRLLCFLAQIEHIPPGHPAIRGEGVALEGLLIDGRRPVILLRPVIGMSRQLVQIGAPGKPPGSRLVMIGHFGIGRGGGSLPQFGIAGSHHGRQDRNEEQ